MARTSTKTRADVSESGPVTIERSDLGLIKMVITAVEEFGDLATDADAVRVVVDGLARAGMVRSSAASSLSAQVVALATFASKNPEPRVEEGKETAMEGTCEECRARGIGWDTPTDEGTCYECHGPLPGPDLSGSSQPILR